MKNTISTIITTFLMILVTSTFAMAEYTATTIDTFPYFQLGCLIIGGLLIMSLKTKYGGINNIEVFGSFALYTILISLFTNPVIEQIKFLVG